MKSTKWDRIVFKTMTSTFSVDEVLWWWLKKCETIQPFKRLILMVKYFTSSKIVTTFFNFKLCVSVGDVKVKSCLMKRNSVNYAYYSVCRMYYHQSCDVCKWLHFCSAFWKILLNTLVWHTVPWCGNM